MSKRGGTRKGAGRKPAPEGTTKIPMTFRISPDIREYLRSRDNATESLESAITRSPDYRDWRHSQSRG